MTVNKVLSHLLFGSSPAFVLEYRFFFSLISIFQRRRVESQRRISDLPRVIRVNLLKIWDLSPHLWLESQVLRPRVAMDSLPASGPLPGDRGLMRQHVPSHSAQGQLQELSRRWKFYCGAWSSLRSSGLRDEQVSYTAEQSATSLAAGSPVLGIGRHKTPPWACGGHGGCVPHTCV